MVNDLVLLFLFQNFLFWFYCFFRGFCTSLKTTSRIAPQEPLNSGIFFRPDFFLLLASLSASSNRLFRGSILWPNDGMHNHIHWQQSTNWLSLSILMGNSMFWIALQFRWSNWNPSALIILHHHFTLSAKYWHFFAECVKLYSLHALRNISEYFINFPSVLIYTTKSSNDDLKVSCIGLKH